MRDSVCDNSNMIRVSEICRQCAGYVQHMCSTVMTTRSLLWTSCVVAALLDNGSRKVPSVQHVHVHAEHEQHCVANHNWSSMHPHSTATSMLLY
jgi:hypothetical protein